MGQPLYAYCKFCQNTPFKAEICEQREEHVQKEHGRLMDIKNPKEWFSVEPWSEKKRVVFRAIKELEWVLERWDKQALLRATKELKLLQESW